MFYTSRSGRPFSYIYASDVNGDGAANDLLYVPKDANDPRNRRVSITLLYRRFG